MKSSKKLLGLIVFTLTLTTLTMQSVFAGNLIDNIKSFFGSSEQKVTVKLDGKEITFPDVKPYVNEDNRTMVPVRFVSEALGCRVNWEEANQMVIINRGQKRILLQIDQNWAIVNDSKTDVRKEFDTKAVMKDDRTMVPLRFVSETLGAGVSWIEKNNTVIINSDGTVLPTETPKPTSTPSSGSVQVDTNFDVSVDPICEQAFNVSYYKSRVASSDGSYEFSYYNIDEKVETIFNYLPSPKSYSICMIQASEQGYTVLSQLLNIVSPEIQNDVLQMVQERVGWQGENFRGKVGNYTVSIVHNSDSTVPKDEQGVNITIY